MSNVNTKHGKKQIYIPGADSNGQKRIMTLDDMPGRSPQINLQEIIGSLFMSVQRTSNIQEIQTMMNTYDRNVLMISSIVLNQEGNSVTKEKFLERGGELFDFMYNSLITPDTKNLATKITEYAKKYSMTLLSVYYSVFKQDADMLKSEFVEYNKASGEFVKFYYEAFKEAVEEDKKEDDGCKKEDDTSDAKSSVKTPSLSIVK